MNYPVAGEFKTLKMAIKYVLYWYPETRKSDKLLYLILCRLKGADTIMDAMRLNINPVSVHKIRQVIQNKEGLYRPDDETVQLRMDRQADIRDLMKGGF